MTITPSLLELSFRNPSFPTLEIESMRLSELKRRMPAAFFRRTQRPRFHLLALFTEGPAVQEVDFVRLDCQAGTLIHVHPGQVIRYVSITQAEAQLLLFTPEFLWPAGEASSALRRGPLGHMALRAGEMAAIRPMFESLAREYAATDGSRWSEAIMRHLLMALLLRIEQAAMGACAPTPPPPVQHQTFARFQQALERDYMRTRSVQAYAQALGCAPRTLNRASLAVAGIPVKQSIDERVALEAKRLLAHTTMSVADIATRLGFSEPTNFIKFFRRNTGQLPGEFRDAQSGGAPRPARG